jgi:hypothetical protein
VAATVALAACGSSSSPTQFPPVAGNYTASFTYELTHAGLDSTVIAPATMTLGSPDQSGTFTGSFHFTGPDTVTGGVAGQFQSNGQITWFTFGDGSGQPPFFLSIFLAAVYPTCNFVGATFALAPGGGFSSARVLTLAGTFSNFKCQITGTDSAASTLSASAVANPT